MPDDPHLFSLPVRIRVIEGGAERVIEHAGDRLIAIGRADDCDIVLTTSRASRRHAEVIGEGGRFTLIDLGSANGTKVGGERVANRPLRPGDEIEIGDARIRFGERAAPALLPDAAAAAASAGAPAPARDPERAAKGARARPVLARRSGMPLVDGLLGVLIVLLVGLLIREYAAPRHAPAELPAGDSAETPSVAAASPGPGAPPPADPMPGLIAQDASDSLEYIERRLADGEGRFDEIENLVELARTAPGTSAAERARALVRVLEGLRRTESALRREEGERALAPFLAAERYGDALLVARALASLGGEEERRHWSDRAAALERAAVARLRGVEEELAALLSAGLAPEALRALVGLRERFGGLDAYESSVAHLLDAALGEIPAVARGESAPPELIELDAQATRAFAECRFADLVPIRHRTLVLGLPNEDRVRVLEELVEAHYLQAMWREFIEGVAGGAVQVELSKHEKGRIVRANEREIEIERAMAGGTYIDRAPWSQVMPAARSAIFAAVEHERDGLLGLAFLARRGGDPEGFDRALLLLHRRGEGRELAMAVLARHRGEAIPAAGYVEHAGRLMTAAEKEAEIARARELRDQERDAMARLRRLEKSERVAEVIEWARVLRAQSSFTLADKVLREVVAETDAEMGAEARRLLDDPLLGSIMVRESGPPERRIDFFILGDGYLVDDEHQQAFLAAARACEKLLFAVDPYREYQSYFNVTAMHLQSKEAGVDRTPGDVVRDTACGGAVRWQTLTSDPELVFSHIRRFPESMARDHQGIVVVNDFADVATGGGGVATVSKAGLSVVQHEVGHAFGGLLDEYDYTPGTDPARPIPKGRRGGVPTAELRPNLMEGSDREDVLAHTFWKAWIEAGEARWWNRSKVSVFEGGNHTPFEVWRPQMGCMMRDGSGFCVVCMETMVKQIYRRVRPIDRLDPEPGAIALASDEERLFQVWPMQPRTHELEAVWRLVSLGKNVPEEIARAGAGAGRTSVAEGEGEVFERTATRTDVDGRTIHGAELRAKDLSAGWYRLKLEVRDPTPWVLEDADGLLTERAQWLIEVKAPK